MRIVRKHGRLGLPFEEVNRRIGELEKEGDEVREQLSKMREKTTWSTTDDNIHDGLINRLSSISQQIIQEKEAYSLHIEEELRDSTKTLNKLTAVLIGVTIMLAILTTLLYFKAH
jgi:uncharacterized protein Yka (UPF0111/DUF47 family)